MSKGRRWYSNCDISETQEDGIDGSICVAVSDTDGQKVVCTSENDALHY